MIQQLVEELEFCKLLALLSLLLTDLIDLRRLAGRVQLRASPNRVFRNSQPPRSSSWREARISSASTTTRRATSATKCRTSTWSATTLTRMSRVTRIRPGSGEFVFRHKIQFNGWRLLATERPRRGSRSFRGASASCWIIWKTRTTIRRSSSPRTDTATRRATWTTPCASITSSTTSTTFWKVTLCPLISSFMQILCEFYANWLNSGSHRRRSQRVRLHGLVADGQLWVGHGLHVSCLIHWLRLPVIVLFRFLRQRTIRRPLRQLQRPATDPRAQRFRPLLRQSDQEERICSAEFWLLKFRICYPHETLETIIFFKFKFGNYGNVVTLFWLYLHAIFTSLALNYTSVDSSWLAQLEIFCIHHDPLARSSAISPEQRAE